MLPLYFPRDKKEEEIAISKLPADVGDENGETVIDERKIRIQPLPNVKKTIPKPPRLITSLDVPVSDQGLARRLVTFKTHFLVLQNYNSVSCWTFRHSVGVWICVLKLFTDYWYLKQQFSFLIWLNKF